MEKLGAYKVVDWTCYRLTVPDKMDEEIEQRLEDLSYLKIPPRDQEENKLLLLRGERIYEESIGNQRILVEQALQKFDRALKTNDRAIISEARNQLKDYLDDLES